jgi:gelsolin
MSPCRDMWQLGSTSSQDEQGAAAYLTVALDDLLGGHPVQYRETQGNESSEFTAMFPSLVILDGGVASGFARVTPETYQARLMHIKGTAKTVRASQVPLGVASLNEGDAFLLDGGLQIWVWNGKEAGPFEKRKAAELAASIASDRKGKAKVQVLESGDTDVPFWTAMGGSGAVASAAAGGMPAQLTFCIAMLICRHVCMHVCVRTFAIADLFCSGADGSVGRVQPKSLWRLSDASGVLTMSELARERFGKDQLNSDDVFFVDMGHTVYVWIGYGPGLQMAVITEG